jgi:hypothetical protein
MVDQVNSNQFHTIIEGEEEVINGINSDFDQLLQVYPNPVFNQLIIEIPFSIEGKIDFEILAIDGKLHVNQPIHDSYTIVDMSILPVGVYLLKVKLNNQIISTKEVIKH